MPARKTSTAAAEPALKKTSMALPAALWKRVRVRAAEDDVDIRDVVIAALEAYLWRH